MDSITGVCDLALQMHHVSLTAAGISLGIFTILTIIHTIQIVRTRTWYLLGVVFGGFCIWFGWFKLIGAAFMIGYGFRIGNAIEERTGTHCWSIAIYIIHMVFLVVAPAFTSASIYMMLRRIMTMVGAEHMSPIRRRWLTWFFVIGDLMTINIQGNGASLQQKKPEAGKWMTIAGLLLQLCIFSIFLATTYIFHRRLMRSPTALAADASIHWKRHISTLYLTGTLILIRSAFRVAEFVQGPASRLMKDEAWMYGFDMVLMTIAMAWMAWFHPSEIEVVTRGELGACGNGWRVLRYTTAKGMRVGSAGSDEGSRWTRDGAISMGGVGRQV